VERRSKRTYAHAEGMARRKKIVFYTSEASNLLKTKDSTFQKRAERTQNEPKLIALCAHYTHDSSFLTSHMFPVAVECAGFATAQLVEIRRRGRKRKRVGTNLTGT